MLKSLALPKGAKEELDFGPEIVEKVLNGERLWPEEQKKKVEDDDDDAERLEEKDENKISDEQKMLLTMFGEGRYHLIPSFFRTLSSLKKQKREFAVCFRTFGEDLPLVTWEFNQFCNGQHPCFSGRNGTPLLKFDGSKGTKDLRIDEPRQLNVVYRLSHELKDTRIVKGISERLTDNLDDMQEMIESEEKYEDCEILSDPITQYQHILETLKKKGTMVFHEDYKNWAANDRHREVAKLLLLDQADYQTQHIFFDDNADP